MGFQFTNAVVYGLQQLSGLCSYSGTKSCPKVEFITDSSLVWIMQELAVILIKRLGEYTSTEENGAKTPYVFLVLLRAILELPYELWLNL